MNELWLIIPLLVSPGFVAGTILRLVVQWLKSAKWTPSWLRDMLVEDETAKVIAGLFLIAVAILVISGLGLLLLVGYLFFGGVQSGAATLVPHKELVYLSIAMMIGMLGSYPFRIWNPKSRESFSFKAFLRPVFVAPLVFIPLWQTVGRGEINLITYLLAYQNGFFWNTVLLKK